MARQLDALRLPQGRSRLSSWVFGAFLGSFGLRAVVQPVAFAGAPVRGRSCGPSACRASDWGRSATEEELDQNIPTLYVYDHCPFCVRARMIFGLKGLPFKLQFLMNDDVVTPTRMIGKKVLPVLEMDGEAMGESLDIVSKIDRDEPILKRGAGREDIASWQRDTTVLVRRLTRPRDARALFPEFATKAARETWMRNHQLDGMSFEEAMGKSSELLQELNAKLPELDAMLYSDKYVNEGGLSYDDITLFPLLRRLSIVKAIEWPEKLGKYTRHMADITDVPLLEGIAM